VADNARYGSQPFDEAIAYFRGKLNLPTRAWTDLWEGMHARAFTVAGAMKAELLEDLRQAVDRAIADGGTLAQFRQDFDAIVEKHGWAYRGGRAWRTRVIYETNLRTAYQAGRYKQLTDPEMLKSRPFWRYEHSDFVAHPRPEHLAWDGLVLPANHPWFQTHFPPNGWGCRCRIHAENARTLKRLGKEGPDEAPPLHLEMRQVGIRGPSPRTVQIPKGIDPGFGYNVGEAAWGRPLAEAAMADWAQAGAAAWLRLTPGSWESHARPREVPLDAPRAQLATEAATPDAMAATLRTALGGEQKVYTVGGLPVLVSAEILARHVDPARSEFLPLLDEVLTSPFEAWLAFEQHKGTGSVRLRSRILKGMNIGHGRIVLFVANASHGMLEGWTVLLTSDRAYANRQRQGLLLYGRD
jgi:hypothetical protein